MRRLLIVFFLLFSQLAYSAAVNFTAKSSHSVVELGQRFQVTFTINAGGGNFTPPDFGTFGVLSGPNQSSSVQIINGRTTQSYTISYILVSTKTGKYNIPPAEINVNGKVQKTDPISIEVVDKNPNGSNAQSQRQNERKKQGDELSDYVFIKSFVDKKSAYVGEKITVTYKLYSKLSLAGINLEALPALNGFWSQDLRSVYDQIELSTEYINGETYQVAELQQTVLYPQRSGKLEIDPLSMKVTVQVRSRRARSMFESMFGSYERKEVITKSRPIPIEIKPLPKQGKPADFSGAVGQFDFSLNASKTNVKSNEAIDFKVVLKGNGNLPLIGAPKIDFPPDFEVYDPETKNNFKTSFSGSKGSKEYNYLVIPRHSGSFKIEPLSFSYFDLATESYKSITTELINIAVEKGEEDESVVSNGRIRKNEVEILENDIRYIHLSNIKLIKADNQFFGSFSYYLIILSLFAILLAMFLISKRLKEKLKDKIGLRKSKANSKAKIKLKNAKKLLDKGELNAFFEEISNALYNYFGDYYNLSRAEVSIDKIVESLSKSEIDSSIINTLKEVIESSEMARFAPQSADSADSIYQKSIDIISEVESILK